MTALWCRCANDHEDFFMAKTFRAQSTIYLREEKGNRDHRAASVTTADIERNSAVVAERGPTGWG